MNINTESLLAAVAQRKQNQIDEIARLEKNRRAEFLTMIDAVAARRSDIADMCRVANAVRHAGIKCDIFTEGYYHRTGFSMCCDNLYGICGGGAYGPSVFFNPETGRFRVCAWYDENHVGEYSAGEMVEKYWNDDKVRFKIDRLGQEVDDVGQLLVQEVNRAA